MSKDWQVFICYRQVDGESVARWLFENLDREPLPAALASETGRPRLLAYFDQAAPAVADWQAAHRPALEDSRALLVVCTPGLCARTGVEDWVHLEIDWWLKHREAAPILVDVTGEGARWVPEKIRMRWPNAQRVRIDPSIFADGESSRWHREIAIQRIVGGISASEAQTRSQDIRRERALNVRLRRYLSLMLTATVVAALGLAATLWFASLATRNEREVRQHLSLTLMRQAEHAWLDGEEISARALAARALSHDPSDEVKSRFLALEHWIAGRTESAEAEFKRALGPEYERLVKVASLPLRAERLARSTHSKQSLDNFLEASRDSSQHHYDVVLKFKGLTHRVQRTVRAQRRGLRERAHDLLAAESEIARLSYSYPSSTSDVSNWQVEYGDVSQRLAVLQRRIHSVQEDSSSPGGWTAPSWQELQAYLRPNEALLDFLLYRKRYAVWILRHTGDPVRVELGEAVVMDDAVQDFQNRVSRFSDRDAVWSCRAADPIFSPQRTRRGAIASGDGQQPVSRSIERYLPMPRSTAVAEGKCRLSSHAARLRELLWAPVERRLSEEIETLYVVPDASLATVPFAAIPAQETDQYLIDDYLLVYLSAAGDLLARAEPLKSGTGILLLGGVDYGEDANEVAPGSFASRLSPLPGSLEEVELIEKQLRTLSGVRPLLAHTGSAANEPAFRRDAPGRSIVHVATHAWTDYSLEPATLDESSMVAAQMLEAHIASLDPALRSGFSLSRTQGGTVHGLEDGIVTALEVSSADLTGVDLVVLSGCDTIGSRVGGEAAIGLFRSFREAGVATVVATLFPVEDKTTAELMAAFYGQLISSKEPSVALRKAAMAMKDRGMAPAHWAGFAVYTPQPDDHRIIPAQGIRSRP